MAEKDTITKEYMQDNESFADVFNFYMYDGEQVIKPESLKPMDTTVISLLQDESDKSSFVQKYRDILKMAAIKTDGETAYVLLGIENQSQISYVMPVRNMLYDAVQYDEQIKEIAKKHKQNGDKAETSEEFLSGFYKTDELIPVITLTILWSPDEWTAPKDLHSMMRVNKSVLKFVDNYHLRIVLPADIADGDFKKFHTELSPALKFIKYSKDKVKLDRLVHEDKTYKDISGRTANMMNVVTGSKLTISKETGGVDMCKAIEDMRADSKMEGAIEIAMELLSEGTLSHEKISMVTKLPLEKVEELAKSKPVPM